MMGSNAAAAHFEREDGLTCRLAVSQTQSWPFYTLSPINKATQDSRAAKVGQVMLSGIQLNWMQMWNILTL
jgi:hypothetical protein